MYQGKKRHFIPLKQLLMPPYSRVQCTKKFHFRDKIAKLRFEVTEYKVLSTGD